MALMERVSVLIRANLNDLIDKAEDPEKMLKQVILDMENQRMQVKTQVAIAMADEHLLLTRQREKEQKTAEWMRKAGLAIDKKNDDLAREAIERAERYRELAGSYAQQVEDQKTEVELLKTSLRKLSQKLDEARSKSELLIARNRRSRAVRKAAEARGAFDQDKHAATLRRMKRRVLEDEAVGAAHAALTAESLDDRFAELERGDRINQLLAELKEKRGLPAARE
jgi:phage shock protein A